MIVVISMTFNTIIMIDYQFMQSGATPLHMACQEGHIEVAQLLLHSGALPNIPDKVSKHYNTSVTSVDQVYHCTLMLIGGQLQCMVICAELHYYGFHTQEHMAKFHPILWYRKTVNHSLHQFRLLLFISDVCHILAV